MGAAVRQGAGRGGGAGRAVVRPDPEDQGWRLARLLGDGGRAHPRHVQERDSEDPGRHAARRDTSGFVASCKAQCAEQRAAPCGCDALAPFDSAGDELAPVGAAGSEPSAGAYWRYVDQDADGQPFYARCGPGSTSGTCTGPAEGARATEDAGAPVLMQINGVWALRPARTGGEAGGPSVLLAHGGETPESEHWALYQRVQAGGSECVEGQPLMPEYAESPRCCEDGKVRVCKAVKGLKAVTAPAGGTAGTGRFAALRSALRAALHAHTPPPTSAARRRKLKERQAGTAGYTAVAVSGHPADPTCVADAEPPLPSYFLPLSTLLSAEHENMVVVVGGPGPGSRASPGIGAGRSAAQGSAAPREHDAPEPTGAARRAARRQALRKRQAGTAGYTADASRYVKLISRAEGESTRPGKFSHARVQGRVVRREVAHRRAARASNRRGGNARPYLCIPNWLISRMGAL